MIVNNSIVGLVIHSDVDKTQSIRFNKHMTKTAAAAQSTVRVITVPGATIAGTTYYSPTLLDVSTEYAKALISDGRATAAEGSK